MKHSFLDKYSDRDSAIHRLDPRAKLLATLAFIAAVVLTPSASWLAYSLYFAVAAVLILLSKVPLSYILRRSLVIIPICGIWAALYRIQLFQSRNVSKHQTKDRTKKRRTSKLKEKHKQFDEKRGSDVQVYANREICQGAL